MRSEECLVLDLDELDPREAVSAAKDYSDRLWGFKIGLGLYKKGQAICTLSSINSVIVDVKLFDDHLIMGNAMRILVSEGATIVTVHCVADWEPEEHQAKHACAVTLLPSVGKKDRPLMMSTSINSIVLEEARKADRAGYKYLMCSGNQLREIVAPPLPAKMIKICNNVRPKWSFMDADTVSYRWHYTTPEQALKEAELIIVGSWITRLANMDRALQLTIDEINALPEKKPLVVQSGGKASLRAIPLSVSPIAGSLNKIRL